MRLVSMLGDYRGRPKDGRHQGHPFMAASCYKCHIKGLTVYPTGGQQINRVVFGGTFFSAPLPLCLPLPLWLHGMNYKDLPAVYEQFLDPLQC